MCTVASVVASRSMSTTAVGKLANHNRQCNVSCTTDLHIVDYQTHATLAKKAEPDVVV